MTSTRFFFPALAAALALGTTGAFAGAEPASPTPVVPPAPPPPPSAVTTTVTEPVAPTPAQVQSVQTQVQSVTSDPPASIPLSLQIRALDVLQVVLASPVLLAQLGFTPAQIEALIAQVETIPTFDDDN